MIVNRDSLLRLAPIKGMEPTKVANGQVTSGLGEAGYDIRIKQKIHFMPHPMHKFQFVNIRIDGEIHETSFGRFALASAIEEFDMPNNLVGIVHDKSSWARKGLSVFNTVVEPGWKGYLTIELVYHGQEELIIPAGSGIAQVVFHSTTDTAEYTGRYNYQENRPVEAIAATHQ